MAKNDVACEMCKRQIPNSKGKMVDAVRAKKQNRDHGHRLCYKHDQWIHQHETKTETI